MDYIVIGLGNPGKKYENTRHNAGFKAIDEFAKMQNTSIDKLKFKSLHTKVFVNGKQILLLKPQTYMNLSGEALIEAMNFFKVPIENVIVLVDDISLPVGKLRIRLKGSHGGQNGLRNIQELTSSEYLRIKIGVGQKPHPSYDLADWVLSNFTKDEEISIGNVCQNISKALGLIIAGDTPLAMSKFN